MLKTNVNKLVKRRIDPLTTIKKKVRDGNFKNQDNCLTLKLSNV